MSKYTLPALRAMTDEQLARAAMELGPAGVERDDDADGMLLVTSGGGWFQPVFNPRQKIDHAWLLVEAVLKRNPGRLAVEMSAQVGSACAGFRDFETDGGTVPTYDPSPAAALTYACLLTL